MEKTVLRQIDELNQMPMAQLRKRWADLMGADPGRRGRQYLMRRLAYRIQELAYGGLSPQARRQLEAVAGGRATGNARPSSSRTTVLATGTRLLREWRGDRYEVIVQAQGYRYNGKVYRSLTAAARAITGQHTSGHLFFGVKQRKRGQS